MGKPSVPLDISISGWQPCYICYYQSAGEGAREVLKGPSIMRSRTGGPV